MADAQALIDTGETKDGMAQDLDDLQDQLGINHGTVAAFGGPKNVITAQMVGELYGVDVGVNSLYDDRVRVCVPTGEVRVCVPTGEVHGGR